MKHLIVLAIGIALLGTPALTTSSIAAAPAHPLCTVFGPNAADCVTPTTGQTSIANHTTTPIPKCKW